MYKDFQYEPPGHLSGVAIGIMAVVFWPVAIILFIWRQIDKKAKEDEYWERINREEKERYERERRKEEEEKQRRIDESMRRRKEQRKSDLFYSMNNGIQMNSLNVAECIEKNKDIPELIFELKRLLDEKKKVYFSILNNPRDNSTCPKLELYDVANCICANLVYWEQEQKEWEIHRFKMGKLYRYIRSSSYVLTNRYGEAYLERINSLKSYDRDEYNQKFDNWQGLPNIEDKECKDLLQFMKSDCQIMCRWTMPEI